MKFFFEKWNVCKAYCNLDLKYHVSLEPRVECLIDKTINFIQTIIANSAQHSLVSLEFPDSVKCAQGPSSSFKKFACLRMGFR